MNRWKSGTALGAVFTLGIGLAPAAGQHEHADHAHKAAESTGLPKCPVMDEPISFASSVATDEGPAFFCCDDCVKKYEANPAKYAGKVAAQRKALESRPKVQLTCPMSGKPVDRKVFTESNGQKIYFCCQGCASKFEKDPAKYQTALANSCTYQTKCPVMGGDINPQAFSTAPNGMNVYYCCQGCEKKFFGDPDKYVPNLVAQGFAVKPDDMKAGRKKEDHSGHDHDHGSHDH